MPIADFPEKELIAAWFIKYLSYKNKYLFNYLSDETVKSNIAELGEIKEKTDYYKWYAVHEKVPEGLDEYKLILSLLLDCDKREAGVEFLHYSTHGNLLLAIGKKQWNETKLTIGSCPFQNIRGIILNETELDSLSINADTQMFEDGVLRIAASHANKSSELGLAATRGLSFENIGFSAFTKYEDVQKTVIDRSIRHAVKNNASILIFPELAFNNETLTYLNNSLEDNGAGLKLVVGGSYYEEKDSMFRNLSPIYANNSDDWQETAGYAKMIPFSTSYNQKAADTYGINTDTYPLSKYKLLTEDISMDDNITLLPFRDCVIGVAICRDVMDLLDSHNPLHRYCDFVDIMLVISDNSGDSNMFVGTAECLARWHNCATVYTNSIGSSRSDPHLEISFALYPFKGTEVKGSTSVSGQITYEKKPFEAKKANTESTVGILYSPGIEYTEFTEEELGSCCKVYTVKAAKGA